MLIVKTTCAKRSQAERLAAALVREGLCACASVSACKSFFIWKGKLRKESEFLLELKTSEGKYERLERRIKILHPYSLPQIIAVRVAKASREYLEWVEKC